MIIEKEKDSIYLYQSLENLYPLSYSITYLKKFEVPNFIDNLKKVISQKKQQVLEGIKSVICDPNVNCDYAINSLIHLFKFYKIGVFFLDFKKYNMYDKINISPLSEKEIKDIKEIKKRQ